MPRGLDTLDIGKPQPSIMTDIARLKEGGVGGQFWSVYTPVELQGRLPSPPPSSRSTSSTG